MNQEALFLVVLAISGLYGFRLALRIAPAMSEFPLKMMAATLFSGGVAYLAFTGAPSATWIIAAFAVAALFILAPLLLIMLARRRYYLLAARWVEILYWTPAGRQALRRLLVQVALQQGDGADALTLLADDDNTLMRIQAYALNARWHDLLELPVPEGSDNALLARASRAQAWLALDGYDQAQEELERMRDAWQAQGQGPLGYRAVTLTQARLYAYEGNFEAARRQLQDPLPGVPSYRLFAILAHAAERSGDTSPAVKLYSQAYLSAPENQRQEFAEKLRGYGQSPPKLATRQSRSATVTLLMVLVLGLAYGVQLWLERSFGQQAARLGAGFLVNIPGGSPPMGVPDADALWRYLSYAFVHGNFLHIALNAWVLYDIGRLYESRRHWGSLLAAFVFGTVLGSYLTITAQGGEPLVLIGASGGVLGVAGALLADTLRSRAPHDRMLNRALLQWIVLIALFSFLPGVSFWGHVGGILGGLLWGFVRQGSLKNVWFDRAAGAVGIGLLVTALVFAGTWLARYSAQF